MEDHMATRSEQLADAYIAVAIAHHYMVGIVEPVTDEERDAAEQILITKQNALNPQHGLAYARFELALALIEYDRKRALYRRSKARIVPENE